MRDVLGASCAVDWYVRRWLKKKKARAEKERKTKLAQRADAKLANVIICEKWDKKAAKFTVPELPFPYTQQDVRPLTVYPHLIRAKAARCDLHGPCRCTRSGCGCHSGGIPTQKHPSGT